MKKRYSLPCLCSCCPACRHCRGRSFSRRAGRAHDRRRRRSHARRQDRPFLKQYGPDYPFQNVMPVLSRADLVAGNLESPISIRGTAVENKKFTLRAGADRGSARSRAPASAWSRLPTTMPWTSARWRFRTPWTRSTENDILFTGAGMDLEDARAPAIVKVKGRTACLPLLLPHLPARVLRFQRAGRAPRPGTRISSRPTSRRPAPLADLVIVSFHWGAELMTVGQGLPGRARPESRSTGAPTWCSAIIPMCCRTWSSTRAG